MRRLATWLPAILWTAVVLSLSSGDFSATNSGSLLRPVLAWLLPTLTPALFDVVHAVIRKTAHLTEYAILAALWLRAFTRSAALGRPRAAWVAVAIAVVVAATDEVHQSLVPSRTGSAADVALDATGALLAIVLSGFGWTRAAELATGVLLWVAAAGGLVALVITMAAGAAAGALWITVPVAAAALVYRWRASSRT